MSTSQKHLVRCRCVLTQFKHLPEPPRHHFVVFSVIDDLDVFQTKFVQCNNCGVIHKVTDICKSEILQGREAMASIVSIDDIKQTLPANLVTILETNNVDLPTWEQAQYVYENKRWGEFVILATDFEDGMKQGKYIRILGENLFKVEVFTREEYVKQ